MTNSSNNDDKLMAYLALQMGKMGGKAVGPVPSDEELAALVDNKLDQVRRAQVMSHLACNGVLYHKWMNLVDALGHLQGPQAYSQQAALSQDKQSRDKRPGLLARIGGALFGSNLRAGVMGGGLATAMLVVLAVLIVPSLGEIASLEEQYDQWSPYIEQNWHNSEHSPRFAKQSSSSRAFSFKTHPQQVIEFGFETGAKRLGVARFRALGIEIDENISAPEKDAALSPEQYKTLLSLGHLTALTTLQCEMQLPAKAFAMSYKTAQKLVAKLAAHPDKKISQVAATFTKQTDRQEAVCQLTEAVLQSVL